MSRRIFCIFGPALNHAAKVFVIKQDEPHVETSRNAPVQSCVPSVTFDIHRIAKFLACKMFITSHLQDKQRTTSMFTGQLLKSVLCVPPPDIASSDYGGEKIVADDVMEAIRAKGFIFVSDGMLVLEHGVDYSNNLLLSSALRGKRGVNISFYAREWIGRMVKCIPYRAGDEYCGCTCNAEGHDCNDTKTCYCIEARCDCNTQCGCSSNANILKRPSYPGLIRDYGEPKGLGVEAIVLIRAGTLIGEYCGEILRNTKDTPERGYEMELRTAGFKGGYKIKGKKTSILIDASVYPHFTAFLNHHCSPNCKAVPICVDALGQIRVFIFAEVDIFPGDEMTLDYGKDYVKDRFVCECGSENCHTPPVDKSARAEANDSMTPPDKTVTDVRKLRYYFDNGAWVIIREYDENDSSAATTATADRQIDHESNGEASTSADSSEEEIPQHANKRRRVDTASSSESSSVQQDVDRHQPENQPARQQDMDTDIIEIIPRARPVPAVEVIDLSSDEEVDQSEIDLTSDD